MKTRLPEQAACKRKALRRDESGRKNLTEREEKIKKGRDSKTRNADRHEKYRGKRPKQGSHWRRSGEKSDWKKKKGEVKKVPV